MVSRMTSLVLFNNDLRIEDNLALIQGCKDGAILPVFILDEDVISYGSASKVWLYHSLKSLNASLNGKLLVFKGNTKHILDSILDKVEVENIYWNRVYEPKFMGYYANLKQDLLDKNYFVKSFNSSLLVEPHEVLKDDGTYYKVFTAFYKKVLQRDFRAAEKAPALIKYIKHDLSTCGIDDLDLLPKKLDWHNQVASYWSIGEQAALSKLNEFVESGRAGLYKQKRDFPNIDGTSLLSVYLHFGQISPNQIVQEVEKTKTPETASDIDCFVSEVIWREFSYYLLYHFKDLEIKNFNPKFDNFKWDENKDFLDKWQKGQTGVPIVDAGMRQLYKTGYMHNRVRMIVASFLVKNLLINWKHGLNWFEDTLFDADKASNAASWQWVAGSGADAAPYFRVFNPILQSEKFDKAGEYIRKYVPELKDLPAKYIHEPSKMPSFEAKLINFTIGEDYPKPIVDLKETRQEALIRYHNIK
jgi:deoxyribodipyrimidine photo-lyase